MRLHPKHSAVALWALLLLSVSQLAAAVSVVLGVDLGQEFIKASLVKPGIPLEIVLTKDSKRKEASAIGFKPAKDSSGAYQYPERVYGGDAINLMARFPKDVYPNLKQLVGAYVFEDRVTTYSSRYPELNILSAGSRPTVAFRSSAAPPGEAGEAMLTVEELLAMQLQSVVRNAEAMAGKGTRIRDIVLTVPPFFTAEERYALYLAADIAGLKVLSFVSDGIAVALNYAISRQFPLEAPPEKHIIYDMGAGSTKATVVEFNGKSVKDIGKFNKTITELNVLGVGFDRSLGGDLFNEKIVAHLLDEFVSVKKSQITNNPSVDVKELKEKVRLNGRTAAKLWREASRVRHILSANSETLASVESLYADVDFRSKKITRAEYEEWLTEYSQRVLDPVHTALASSGLTLADIKSVIIHGGAVRTPFVGRLLAELVGEDKINKGVNSDEAAVMGATFRGAGLSGSFRVKEIRVHDVAVYPVVAKYKRPNSDKELTQTIFPAYSRLGIEKLLPIRTADDVSFSLHNIFWSKNDKAAEEQIVHVTTKNLTASIKKLSDEFKCIEGLIRTEFGIKLKEKDAQPEITSAWTGCEVEYEEDKKGSGGIVDDVKGFFGFGKKKTDGEQVVLEHADHPPPSPSADSTASDAPGPHGESPSPTVNDGENPNSHPDQQTKKMIKKFEKILVGVDVQKGGLPQIPVETLRLLIHRLKAFDEWDAKRRQREETRNKLEAFVYKLRAYVTDDEHFLAAAPAEILGDLRNKVLEIGEWIYEEGESATLEVLKERLKTLTDLEAPISRRKAENLGREERVKLFKDAIQQTKHFIALMKDTRKYAEEEAAKKAVEEADTAASPPQPPPEKPAEGEKKDALDELDDDAAALPPPGNKEEKREEIPPLSPYTKEEIAGLTNTYETVRDWLEEKLALQSKKSLFEDPAVTIKEMEDKLMEMNAKFMEILDRQMKNQKKKEGKEKPMKGKKEKTTKDKKSDKKKEVPKHDEL